MKVKLKINVEGIGKHGDTVEVAAALGKWLVDGRYADQVDEPAPDKPPAKKAPAKAASKKAGA